MSGARAKADRRVAAADRRVDALTEAIVQAHDRLHKDQVDECHELLHQALGTGEVRSDVANLTDGNMHEFDQAFQRLCIDLNVHAAFVAGYPVPDQPGTLRMVTGGDAWLCAKVDTALRAETAR